MVGSGGGGVWMVVEKDDACGGALGLVLPQFSSMEKDYSIVGLLMGVKTLTFCLLFPI